MSTVLNVTNKVMDTATTKMTCDFKGYDGHKGVDLIPKSTPETPYILAYDDGTVLSCNNFKGTNYSTSTEACGTYIAIKHKNNTITRYQHLMYGSLLVKVGDKVTKGQKIAKYGRPTTGNSSGCHLHFDISFPNAQANCIRGYFAGEYRYYVDPKPYLLGTNNLYKVTADVNIRDKASTNSNIIGEYKKNTKVEVLGTYGNYYRTKDGYCHKNFFKKV